MAKQCQTNKRSKNPQKTKKLNHQKLVLLKPLEAQSRGKTLEMIIEKRMQNMVHFENKNIIFVDKIHFEKRKQKTKEIRIGKLKN